MPRLPVRGAVLQVGNLDEVAAAVVATFRGNLKDPERLRMAAEIIENLLDVKVLPKCSLSQLGNPPYVRVAFYCEKSLNVANHD